MSTRTFEELKQDVAGATNRSDALALEQCAGELAEIGSPEAMAVRSGALGWAAFARGSHTEALEHFHRAKDSYDGLGDRPGVATSMSNSGMVNTVTGNYSTALEEFHRSLKIWEELGNRLGVARANSNIGIVHKHQGDLASALERYNRTLAICEELGDHSGVASVSCSLGNLHRITGDFAEALSYYYRSLQIYEGIGNKRYVAVNYGCIGSVYENTGNYPQALEEYYRALAIYEDIGDRVGVAGVTMDIGALYSSTGNYQLALEHFQKADVLHTEVGNRLHLAYTTGNIGIAYAKLQDYALALEYHRRALALVTEVGASEDMTSSTGNVIATLILMGSFTEAEELLATLTNVSIKDPAAAIGIMRSHAAIEVHHQDLDGATHTLRSALSDAQRYSLLPETASIHKELQDLCQQRNDFAGYIEHNNEFTRVTEEINGKDTATKLAIQDAERKMAKERSEHGKYLAILHSALPKHVAERVARGEVVNDSVDNAAVLFLDVVGFTTHSSELGANVVVDLLQQIFTAFDAICAEHSVMKIKTIGDSYMAVAFPSEHHLEDLVAVALAMQSASFTWPHTSERVMFRIGLHCGPVVAGVLGTERMQYDVWGDTVNVASRMESSGEAGRVHISEAVASELKRNTEYTIQNSIAESENPQSHEVSHNVSHSVSHNVSHEVPLVTRHSSLVTTPRGSVDIKGKGPMQTYWLESTS